MLPRNIGAEVLQSRLVCLQSMKLLISIGNLFPCENPQFALSVFGQYSSSRASYPSFNLLHLVVKAGSSILRANIFAFSLQSKVPRWVGGPFQPACRSSNKAFHASPQIFPAPWHQDFQRMHADASRSSGVS
jgi:hypothetical protein